MPSNADLMRRWFEEVWNQLREATVFELLDGKAVLHGVTENREPVVGPDAFVAFHRQMRATLTNIHVTVHDLISEGDLVATRITVTAVHGGSGMGIAPTNRNVTFSGIIMARWQNGKVVEAWNEYDALGMMRQVMLPK